MSSKNCKKGIKGIKELPSERLVIGESNVFPTVSQFLFNLKIRFYLTRRREYISSWIRKCICFSKAMQNYILRLRIICPRYSFIYGQELFSLAEVSFL